MPKGEQRSNKMVKKPKKDSGLPVDTSTAPNSSPRPVAPTTSVFPKGKLKNK